MSEDVKAALTAEEWRIVEGGGEFGFDGVLYYGGRRVPTATDSSHGLAALALHNQPYGFTWEDVDNLRTRAMHLDNAAAAYNYPDGHQYREGRSAEYFANDAAWCRSLADRIAALLPPRQTPETT